MCAFASIWQNVLFNEKHMYFLNDTHHGTTFSTFSSLYRPKMEMKTCRFGDILYSATRSTSCQWFLKLILVGDKWMFLIGEKKRQWWSCWSSYHHNQHFPVTPYDKWIIEITPLSWDRDSGKRLCVHLLLFDKMYHFIKSACISCMILTMALCSPPFPCFFGQKRKWRHANLVLFQI